MDRTLQSLGCVRVVDEKKGIVESVISSGDIARDDAIILVEGWELDTYQANPVILWCHDDRSLPIARTIDLQKGKDELTARAQFDMEDPEAARIFGKIKRGFINAASVRWLPLETETRKIDERDVLVFVRQELLEWSFVSVPADAKALVMRSIPGSTLGEPVNARTFRPLGDVLDEAERLLAARRR